MTSLGPPAAEIEIRDGVARAAAFDDIYFSAADGLAETRAVFLSGCGVPDAWRDAEQFVIAELGFGSGLNFLASWDEWDRNGPADGQLHFISVDGFPLNRAQATTMLAGVKALNDPANPGLADKRDALLKAWPPQMRGVHRITLNDRVALTIAHLEAGEALAQLEFAADAWFLDGFAPSKNPDMWSRDILAAIASRAKPEARLASFTVAGEIRRGLSEAGFSVEKKAGHGKKRERLEARFHGGSAAATKAAATSAPPCAAKPRNVLIIGAGPAGAFAALALKRRGVDVTVIDGSDELRGSASGAPYALMTPRLDLDDRPEARFHRAAWAFADHLYTQDLFQLSQAAREICAIRLVKDDAERERLEKIARSRMAPSDWIAAQIGEDGLSLQRCRIIAPQKTVSAALTDCSLILNRRAASLKREHGVWRALDAEGEEIARAEFCVVAAGIVSKGFAQTEPLALNASRGQLSSAPLAADRQDLSANAALLYGGHAFSADDGRLYFGATYEPAEPGEPLAEREDDARYNLAQLAASAPETVRSIATDQINNHVGLRATTPDRLPICGPVPDWSAYAERFAHLKTGKRDPGGAVPYQDGLYLLTGLGSRAFLWAPLLGEALAAKMLHEPSPLERDAALALHPGRFVVRALKRGN